MKVARTNEKDLLVFPPAIPFHPKPNKKAEEMERDKSKYVTYDVKIGGDKDDGETTEWSIRIFEDGGDAEDYVKWRIRFEELAEAMRLTSPEKKYTVLQTILRGKARARFNSGWHSVEISASTDKEKRQKLEEKRLLKGFNALIKQLFAPVESAWRRQRSYLRYHAKFGNMTVSEFKQRLVEQNEFLKYFPPPNGKNAVSKLTEEELVEILDRAKPVEYHCDVLSNNYDPYQKTLQEYTEYLERLETKHNIQKAMAKRNNQQQADDDDDEGGKTSKNKKNSNKKRKRGGGNGAKSGSTKCNLCGNPNHMANECWENDRNANKRPPGWKPRHKRQQKAKDSDFPRLSAEQMSFLMKNFEAIKKNEKVRRGWSQCKVTLTTTRPLTHIFYVQTLAK